MSKCACCSRCGEPIQEPHNFDGLCNECSPYVEICFCGEVITSLEDYNFHVAGDRPCMPQPPADKEPVSKNEKCPF